MAGSLGRHPAEVAGRRSGENFPVALRVLPRRPRAHLLRLYAYARFVDDLGDRAPGGPDERLALLDAVDADLDRLFGGVPPRLPVLAALAPTVAECALPERPLRDLVRANRVDQQVTRYPCWADLRAYCRLSAEPVGRLVLAVAGAATAERVARSDDVCTALQLLEHLQDVGEDAAAGRVYLPVEELRRFRVAERDLTGRRTPPELRRLVAAETGRAANLLRAGPPLVAGLTGWARVAVAGFVAGGRATVAALDGAGHDVLGRAVRPSRARTAAGVLRLLAVRSRA